MDALADWLDACNLTEGSRRAYRAEVARLQRYLARRHLALDDVDSALLRRFWAGLQRGRWHETRQTPTAGSQQQSRRIIAAFLRWAVQHGRVAASCLSAVRAWRVDGATTAAASPVRPLSAVQLRRLLDASDLDAAAAALCFWTGATPRELSALRLVNIDLDAGHVTLARRHRGETVAIPRVLARALAKLLPAVGPYVFGGTASASPAALSQRIRRWVRTLHVGQLGSARALRAHFHAHAEAAGWSGDEIRAQLRRPSLPLSPATPPAVRRLDAVVRAA